MLAGFDRVQSNSNHPGGICSSNLHLQSSRLPALPLRWDCSRRSWIQLLTMPATTNVSRGSGACCTQNCSAAADAPGFPQAHQVRNCSQCCSASIMAAVEHDHCSQLWSLAVASRSHSAFAASGRLDAFFCKLMVWSAACLPLCSCAGSQSTIAKDHLTTGSLAHLEVPCDCRCQV